LVIAGEIPPQGSATMIKKRFDSLWPALLLIASLTLAAVMIPVFAWQRPAKNQKKFEPVETTIAEIHQAMRSGKITCRQLVEAYLKRINAYDQSTKLNSIVIVNPQALAEADRLDAEFKRTRKLRPLHGIPVIVKDNYDTRDLQTTGGSLALKGSIPPDDAFQVRKLREAGAIVLAKSNMAEWAFSPMLTESSIAGVTRNPYELERVPAGSSGGTAAAVAASFGAVGLGTDTGNSIRGPSSHNALVGIRSTMGLTSRDGIIPLYLRNDIGGPMARTVEDAVRVLEVIAGYDPADPITKASEGKMPKNYTQFLKKNGLKGARLGVFRRYVDAPTTDPQIKALVAKAIEDLKAQGAVIVDPFDVPNFEALTQDYASDAALSGFVSRSAQHRVSRRAAQGDGERPARRHHLSDVEQRAAQSGRSAKPRRRQQPDALAANRLPGDHRADGIHVWLAAGRTDLPGQTVQRAGFDPDCLRL
jgi:Asp-tRNA(Asn)/Glu-tRNA(Gln) amidotransferase A subunit family amidase